MDIKLCRLCCINEGAMNIFHSHHHEILKISAKITYCCATLNVIEGDDLPALICHCCKDDLDAAYSFITRCEDSDRKLRLQVTKAPYPRPECKIETKFEETGFEDNNFDNTAAMTFPQNNFIEVFMDDFQDLEVMEESKAFTKTSKRTYKKRKKNGEEIFTCPICGKVKENRSSLMIHMQFHNDGRLYQCTSCTKNYKDQGSLNRHIQRNHVKRERNFTCEECGKGFYTKNDVKLHLRIHSGEKPFACLECPKKFTQLATLLRHKLRHTGLKAYNCKECPKKFCTNEELKHHLLVHTDVKCYTCPICGVSVKYKNNIKKHILVHSSVKNFICDYCSKSFRQKGGLKNHIDRQHSEKSGYCNVCCKNVSNLDVHMWRHTGHKPLQCNVCSSHFSDLKVLSRHVNYYHKHPDKFKCSAEGCTMAFPSKPMLDFHRAKLHETGIPFPCCKCSRGFYRLNDLARHMNGTHKELLIQ